MKKIYLFIIIFISISTVTSAQTNKQDVIYLENGSIIRGKITEQIYNTSLKIQTADNNVYSYNLSEVSEIKKELVPVIRNNTKDTVFLKNGNIVIGEIIEHLSNKSIKIQTVESSIFVFMMDEIKKMPKDESQPKQNIASNQEKPLSFKIDTLTNQKIIQLTQIGLQPSVIINKINSSINIFDVSTDALIKLSENKVASEVINEMMKYNTQQQTIAASQKDMKDPLSMRSPGIYYYDKNDKEKPIKKIDASVSSSAHSGGGSFYGIGGSKELSNISGGQSQTQIEEPSLVIYFYFEKNDRPGASNWWFATASSPKEFVLVKLDVSKKARSFQTGGSTTIAGFGGSNAGIPERDKVSFDYTEIADGIYKVTFKQALKEGEYCFVYASATPSMFTNDKVFDFGIKVY